MAAPSPLPTYVYKILDGPPTEPLPTTLPVSDLDAKDGFVHLSVAAQVPNTANLFFDAFPSLWVLKVPLAGLGDTRWEDSDGQGRAFPHFYGALGAAHVESVRELKKPAGGWAALSDGWLE